ncbi:MAG: hypothetical protein LUE24_12225 [Lachnospiraceae bacterium]|nr:hypothetical protein [Lachnospiraceae bacterium]
MKKRVLNNLSWKILSVVAAIICWIVVVNIDDTIESKTIRNVSVTLINTDALTSQDQTYMIEEGTDKVNITVYARRTELAKVKESDFTVTADVEKDLRYDSMVKIEVSYTGSATIDSVSQSRENVLLSIEEKVTEQFKVIVETTGEPADGLVVGATTPEQTLIEVSGPKSEVERVKRVVAEVDITGITGTTTRTCTLRLTNSDGEEITSSQLEYTGKDTDFSVTVTTLSTKLVGISFDVSEAAPEGYSLASISYKPETVTIVGEESDIRSIYNLSIPASALNPDGETGTVQQTVDISQYLDDDILIPSEEEKEIAVTMEIVENETVEYSVSSDSVVMENLANGLEAILTDADALTITVTGLPSTLAELTTDDITVSIDLSEITRTGTYTAALDVALPDGLSCADAPEITVEVVEAEEEE